jgi:hypothetical protein
VKAAGWPTTEELRGRFIAMVIGNYRYNAGSYEDYVLHDGGVNYRAAFPMRSVLSADPDTPCTGDCDTIRQAEVFWQVEAPDKKDLDAFLRDHGVARGPAAHMIEDPVPSGNPDDIGKVSQRRMVSQKLQILMTDYPWNFITDAQYGAPLNPAKLPSRPDRPFFERADTDTGVRPLACKDDLREPGSRIYFNTAERFVNSDVLAAAAGRLEKDPAKTGFGEAFLARPDQPTNVNTDVWEVYPATTIDSHGKGPLNASRPARYSKGCFFARNDPGATEMITVCRYPAGNDKRNVFVEVGMQRAGKPFESFNDLVPHNTAGGRPGDSFRIVVERLFPSRTTAVQVFTANAVGPDGSVLWQLHPLHDRLGPRIFFSTLLTRQGLRQEGNGVFTSTRLNGRPVPLSSLTVLGSHVADLSWCDDGSCRFARPLSPETVVTHSGVKYVEVHEATGKVFGQPRTLLTTDGHELFAGGLTASRAARKFLLRRDPPGFGTPWAAVHRCVDWRENIHMSWIDTDPGCPNDRGAPGLDGGVLGFIATDPAMRNVQPLWHLRLEATSHGESADDHLFAVGDGERAAGLARGYKQVGAGPVGFVNTDAFPPP